MSERLNEKTTEKTVHPRVFGPGSQSEIPKSAFDIEYSTQWRREVLYLHDKGIEFSYVRDNPRYDVKTYKYKKTPELFKALADFYEQVIREKAFFAELEKRDKKALEVKPLPELEGGEALA